jgi:hypothetical protein
MKGDEINVVSEVSVARSDLKSFVFSSSEKRTPFPKIGVWVRVRVRVRVRVGWG